MKHYVRYVADNKSLLAHVDFEKRELNIWQAEDWLDKLTSRKTCVKDPDILDEIWQLSKHPRDYPDDVKQGVALPLLNIGDEVLVITHNKRIGSIYDFNLLTRTT